MTVTRQQLEKDLREFKAQVPWNDQLGAIIFALEFALEHATFAPAPVPDLDDLARRVKLLELRDARRKWLEQFDRNVYVSPPIWVAPSPWTYSTVYCGNQQQGGSSAKIESET